MNVEEWMGEFFQILEENQMTAKQKQILLAAIEVFANKGYAGASTSEIAKKAGVAEGTIFRHYKTKKELLLSIVVPVMTKLVAPFFIKDVRKVLDQDYPSYEDFLRALIENRIMFVQKYFPIVKIFLQEIPFHDELKDLFQNYVVEHVYERLKEIVTHFQKKGEIIDLPPQSIIRQTVASIAGMLITHLILVPDSDWKSEQTVEETIQMLLNGIRKT